MSSGAIILGLVAAVTVMGFLAARWGHANLTHIDEWALGGRRFGTFVSWFLLGGDLYTAYTFIAVPALVYGAGALGFFAVPYTSIAYPIAFVVLVRFWAIARKRGYVTAADFVRDRFGDRVLEVASQRPVSSRRAVHRATASRHEGRFRAARRSCAQPNGLLALTVAFVVLAAYTYTSGLRAPALIAFVKDVLIYVTVIAAAIVIPAKLGGWAHIFLGLGRHTRRAPQAGIAFLQPSQYFAYATMALGSAMSLFIYPHSITSVLAAKSKEVIRRNAALLPIYSILLAVLALLGYCAVAAGIVTKDSTAIVPLLFARFFPDWFAGIADAAIVIGALVPAAIMSIGSANLFVSNVFKEFSAERSRGDARLAKLLTLVMCVSGLLIIFFVPVTYAIDFQLLGGALMLQILPAFVLGLWTRWFHPRALMVGWGFGGIASCVMGTPAALPRTTRFIFSASRSPDSSRATG